MRKLEGKSKKNRTKKRKVKRKRGFGPEFVQPPNFSPN
jgi:hypothetical protein